MQPSRSDNEAPESPIIAIHSSKVKPVKGVSGVESCGNRLLRIMAGGLLEAGTRSSHLEEVLAARPVEGWLQPAILLAAMGECLWTTQSR